jgi:hypothetical protein
MTSTMAWLDPAIQLVEGPMNVDQVLAEFKKSGARSGGQASVAKPSPARPK